MRRTAPYTIAPRKFEEYGKLSHKNLDDLRSGERSLLVTGEDEKEDPLDSLAEAKKQGAFIVWNHPGWPIIMSHYIRYMNN